MWKIILISQSLPVILPPSDDMPPPNDTETPDDTEPPNDMETPDDTASPDGTEPPDSTESPDDTDTPDGPEIPDNPEKPNYPGLEMVDHRIYIRGQNDFVRPEGQLTRAEAAQIVYSILEYEPERTGSKTFTDVRETAWYGKQVLALAEMGIVNGPGDGTFQPNRYIRRNEFVQIITQFFDMESEEIPAASFPDVNQNSWDAPAINYAAAKGWIAGSPDGTFRPNNYISRAEAITVVNKALGRKPDPERLKADGYALVFLDLPYSHWAYGQIMEAALEHIHNEGGNWQSYILPVAEHEPGNHLIGGELYQVDSSGHWVHNKTDGVLRFDHNGRYTTGDASLDKQLTDMVKKYTKEGDSNLNNYKRLYDQISTWPYRAGSYLGVGSQDGQTGWETNMALDMLKNRKGNCYRYAGLGTMLARKLGFQATGISGQVNVYGRGFVLHGWVEIELDGQIFICDPQQQYRWPKENLFMRKYSEFPSTRKYRVKNIIKK
ncbi:S-layer homology domain-containing protein [Acutalibacter caecimuris]|uniref:S-layer homology domain-containing protein n=1 Tax=Acutalibacter caecimuris TaxID=3093657 RepID=UPI002AC8B47E|nr:S-layer homology domain-containing protein [Acutalibacter sp. M00118]